MTREQIEKDLRRETGGSSFVSLNQLRKWMGVRHETAKELVEGLDHIKGKRTIRYFVGDVAARVIRRTDDDDAY